MRLERKEPKMLIIGCDYHPSLQQIAEDGKSVEALRWAFCSHLGGIQQRYSILPSEQFF